MPRTIWNGVVSFGLVNIGVKMYSAVSRKAVRFNQIDSRTQARIRQKRVSAADGTEVPNEALVKGYEVAKDEYVIVTDEELAALDPAAQRTIEIEEFVDLDQIDPILYDAAYYLAPASGLAKPYKLLVEAMTAANKVGIAHFVMRSKQYVAAVRPVDGRLVLSTMIYADEVVDPAEIPEFDDLEGVEESPKELAIAEQIIESLSAEFEPEKYRDSYREQVLSLIERKRAGEETIVTPGSDAEPATTNVIDLMAVLEQSLAEMEEARERHPTAHDADEDATAHDAGEDEPDEDGEEEAGEDEADEDEAGGDASAAGSSPPDHATSGGRKPSTKESTKKKGATKKAASKPAKKAPGKKKASRRSA